MEQKKKSKQKMQVTTPGFEPAPQLPPAQKAKRTLVYLSLPFTLFEPCGAVFIMNSKIHVRRNS